MYKIFICANKFQSIAAKVSKNSILNRSNFKSSDIEILLKEDFDFMNKLQNIDLLRSGEKFRFTENDMQNFTLLRFHVPKLMGYQGRALVIDPDVFQVREGISDLFNLPSQEFAIHSREGKKRGYWSSSVMLLNNKKLKHWNLEDLIYRMHKEEIDYQDLISLKNEKSICPIRSIWNEYDDIKPETIFLHTTEKITQPWRKGLKLDSSIPKIFGLIPREKIYKFFGKDLMTGREHPRKIVSDFFFAELADCYKKNLITDSELKDAISQGLIRKDIYKKLRLSH